MNEFAHRDRDLSSAVGSYGFGSRPVFTTPPLYVVILRQSRRLNMGSGARHGGRRRAAHHRRARQNRRRRHRRNHRAHAHHNNGQPFQNHIIFGAVHRRRTNDTSQTSQGVNVTYYSSSNSSVSSSALAYFPMCRVLSVFLWFAGIMMMSLGGFRTPIGFIGVGCLVVGILMLILTSLFMSGSCAQHCQSNADPEQPVPANAPEGNDQAARPVRPVVAISPPDAAAFNDSAPNYPSPDPASDKPPSYEEVMAGQYPPTISATVLPPIPEDMNTEPVLSQGMTASAPTMPPYPVNYAQAQPYGYPPVQPYPPVDVQSYQRTETERTQDPNPSYPPPITSIQVDPHMAVDTSFQVNTTQSTENGDSSQISSSFVPQPESRFEEVEPVMPMVPPQPQVSPPISTSSLVETSLSSNTLPVVQVDTLQTLPLEPSSQTQTSMHLSDSSTAANNSVEHSSHGNTEVITVINEVEGTANIEKTDLQSEYVNGLPQSMDASVRTESYSEC